MDKKTVVIAGGSEGLGKAVAKRMITAGNRVIIISRSEKKLKATSTELGCEYRVCDVSDFQQIEKIAVEIGNVDILVNSAGVWIEGPLMENSYEKIQEVFSVNTLGTIFVCKAIIPFMKSGGVIVNVVSQGGIYVKAGRSVYYSSKWAITGFTKCLEIDLASAGIKVVGIYPSLMKTNMFVTAGVNKDISKGLEPDDVAKAIEFAVSFGPEATTSSIEIKNPKY